MNGMDLRKILHLICPFLQTLCLAWGLAKIGQGLGFAAGLLTLGVWLLAYKWPDTWLPSMALVLTVGLAVIGLCQGVSALLMLAAATLALVNWDLALLDRPSRGNSSVRGMTFLEKKHFQSLLLMLGLALPALLVGRIIHFPLPFGMMILLVILAFFSLTRLSTLFSD